MSKLLIVEDDRGLSALLEDWFGGENHEVTAVYNGAAAWEELQSQQFDLIVMDWDLPDDKGVDIVSRFRAEGGVAPIIMLTGHSSIDDKEIGFDAGANDYLTKPFHVKELSARIKAVLRTQAAAAPPPPPEALGEGNEEVLRAANLTGSELASRYEFLEIIGTGASAMVLKARRPFDEPFAIKILFPGLFSPEQLQQFQNDAEVMREMSHPNIATVYEHGLTERGQPFVVMEYVQGEALSDKIRRERQLPLPTVLAIVIQVCNGLQEAHDRGIVHGDLKLENVLLKDNREQPDWVKIVDFGMAQLVTSSSQRLKGSSSVMRSMEYAAPERIDSVLADERWDVYSLGIMLFEMLTVRLPFEADTVESLMIRTMIESIVPPSQYRPDLESGGAIDRLLARATEKNPDNRYQSATELRLDLELVQEDLSLRPGV